MSLLYFHHDYDHSTNPSTRIAPASHRKFKVEQDQNGATKRIHLNAKGAFKIIKLKPGFLKLRCTVFQDIIRTDSIRLSIGDEKEIYCSYKINLEEAESKAQSFRGLSSVSVTKLTSGPSKYIIEINQETKTEQRKNYLKHAQ